LLSAREGREKAREGTAGVALSTCPAGPDEMASCAVVGTSARTGRDDAGDVPPRGAPRPCEPGAALPPDRLGRGGGDRLRRPAAARPGGERARARRPPPGLPPDGPARTPGARRQGDACPQAWGGHGGGA